MQNKAYLKRQFPALLKKPVGELSCEKAIASCGYFDQDTGKFIGIILPKLLQHERVSRLLDTVKFIRNSRLSGLATMSHIFGIGHRDLVKNLATRNCAFNRNYPEVYGEILKLLNNLEVTLEDYPEIYPSHLKYSQEIADCWKMGKGLFTSGIINTNSKLLYHTDNGNAQGCYSFMLVIKKGVVGGNLHLPEYNIELPLNDGDVILFDGANVSHGVTPFRLLSPSSKRYTIVFYTNERLKKAMPSVQEELNYVNKSITNTLINRRKKQ